MYDGNLPALQKSFPGICGRCNQCIRTTIIDASLHTAQKVKFSIKDFFSKCGQIRSFLRIWSPLLKKSLMENFIFCAAAGVYLWVFVIESIFINFYLQTFSK